VPHRLAIEGSEDATHATAREHDDGPNETWNSQEQGRSYALPYDKLVIATGTYNRTFGTPGVRENAWFLKDVQNARSIRFRIMECFEQAEHPELTEQQRRNLLAFIVVGGGPTGSEMASALFDMVHNDIRRVFPHLVELCSITIVDAAGSILNTFDKSLQEYAQKTFQRDGIQLKLNRKPVRVERGNFVVEPDGEMPFGLLVWSTGNTQGPLVKGITNVKKDQTGALITDDRLEVIPSDPSQSELLQGVYAMGDCAQIDDHALPATAQVAAQKGKFLAKLLNSQGASGESFKYQHSGTLANLSGGRGIAQFSKGGKLSGRSASALWHSTYSLYMSVSWRNKIAIPFTWMLNRIFGRTLSRI
jgi:NADH dehydrogenase